MIAAQTVLLEADLAMVTPLPREPSKCSFATCLTAATSSGVPACFGTDPSIMRDSLRCAAVLSSFLCFHSRSRAFSEQRHACQFCERGRESS